LFPAQLQITSEDILTYDAVMVYAEALSTAAQLNTSFADGVGIVNLVKNNTFTSKL